MSNLSLIPLIILSVTIIILRPSPVSGGKDKEDDIIIIGGEGGGKGGHGHGGGGGMPLILITGDGKKKKGQTILIIFPQKPHHHHHFVEAHGGGGYGGGGESYGGGGGASYGGGGGSSYGGGEAITYEPAKGGGDEYGASNLIRMLNRGPQRGGGGVIPLSMSGSENRPVIINANSLRGVTGGGTSNNNNQGMNGFGGMDSTYDLSSYGSRDPRPSYFGGLSTEEQSNNGVRFITI